MSGGTHSHGTATMRSAEDDRPKMPWSVVVAYHPEAQWIGRSVRVDEGSPLKLGREGLALGAGVLDDAHLSRQHAELTVDGDGALQVRDLDSHNGTYVNGARISVARIGSGDVLGLGRLLLLPERVDREFITGDGTDSWAWSQCVASVDRAAERGTPVLLWGPSGVGKDRLAKRLHARSGRSGEFVLLRCSSFGDHASDVLMGKDSIGLLEEANGGTLYIDGIDDAAPALQAALLELLEHGVVRRLDTGEATPLSLRFVASCRRDPATLRGVRQDFLQRLGGWVVPVPPLARRRSDIARLALLFVQRYAGEDATLHPELMFALLRHKWPGNVRELEAIVERAVVECAELSPIAPFADLDALLGGAHTPATISTMSRAPRRTQPWVVAASGGWFSTPQGDKHDLSRRKVLARLLRALVQAHCEAPGERLTVTDLLGAAWPDEAFVGNAGANRVYVALATLRKLGLRDVVVRNEGGYVIDPGARVQVIEA